MKIKEPKEWPDKVRLEMIEKSKIYDESPRVYQYGYYDGFQKAIEHFNILKS